MNWNNARVCLPIKTKILKNKANHIAVNLITVNNILLI